MHLITYLNAICLRRNNEYDFSNAVKMLKMLSFALKATTILPLEITYLENCFNTFVEIFSS